MKARDGETAGLRPGSGRRVVKLRARDIAAAVAGPSCCDKHHAVLQQRCRMRTACDVEAAGLRPGSGRRIVELRAREYIDAVEATCDKHLAVGKQSLRVINASGGEAAGLLEN